MGTRRLAVYLIPIVAALVLYAPTVGYDLTFDDHHHVAQPGEPPVRTLSEVWSGPFLHLEGQKGGFYRPIVSTTFWLEGVLNVPLGVRHAVNVLLHALATLLVTRLMLSLTAAPWAAALAGILFAVHPVHVEAVAGLVGRADLMAAVFTLLALAVHDHDHRTSRSRNTLWAAALSFLASGSKEYTWTLPVLALCLDLGRGRRLSDRHGAWIGYAIGIGAHLLLRRWALGAWLDEAGAGITPMDNPLVVLSGLARLVAGLGVVGLNLTHLLAPVVLSPDRSGSEIVLDGSLMAIRPALGLVLMAALGAGTAMGLRHARQVGATALGVGAAWLLVFTVLFMNLWLDLVTIFADRLLYWPSIGLALVVAGIATRLGALVPRALVVTSAGLLVTVIVAYTVRAATYLPTWKNNEVLFTAAIVATPRAPRPWLNVAKAHYQNGRLEDALDATRHARVLFPDFQEAWAYEGTMLLTLGRWKQAEVALSEALRRDPYDVVVINNLGVALLQDGRADEAAGQFHAALARDPTRTQAILGLAEAEAVRERYGEAAAAWQRYLDVAGADPDVQDRLARTLATKLDRLDEAEALARRVVAANPDVAAYRDTLAEVLRLQAEMARP